MTSGNGGAEKVSGFLRGVAVPAVLIAVWQLLSMMGYVNPQILPAPSAVLVRWYQYLAPIEAFDPAKSGYVAWLLSGELVADAAGQVALQLGYDLIDRKQLGLLMRESDLSEADLLKPGTGAKVGKTLGIQAVIVGSVNEFNHWSAPPAWGNLISFTARMVRLDTGQVMWSVQCEENGQAEQSRALRLLLEDAAAQLRQKGAARAK